MGGGTPRQSPQSAPAIAANVRVARFGVMAQSSRSFCFQTFTALNVYGIASRHQEIAGELLHGFVVLIVGGGAHPDRAAIGFGLRGPHFEYFALGMQFVAGAYRLWPTERIEADPKNAASRLEVAIDQEPHGQRGRVPAAGSQSAERRFFRRVLVEMIGLRIELLGE